MPVGEEYPLARVEDCGRILARFDYVLGKPMADRLAPFRGEDVIAKVCALFLRTTTGEVLAACLSIVQGFVYRFHHASAFRHAAFSEKLWSALGSPLKNLRQVALAPFFATRANGNTPSRTTPCRWSGSRR